ncbi:hypothetical protein Lesp02_34670 [Lentzea sp. NBRC 105346]|uniref:lasso peptide biosynthesis B2 protein n=1 Tax=Lentzea sp. NBRC 105346 TaxID=3032205 RepID=UPI0024A233FA|nr:lasso peptide biosynthesis B2 protein [Lentzea sp. NBRC 105346]GLZ31279.1 hypothetical protein Lesp02_34670 [Lentzea sp. NBRC 105346]
MSAPVTLDEGVRLPVWRRGAPLLAVIAARVLARAKPYRIRRILERLRRGAAPATHGQALAARQHVVAVSTMCAGRYCLQRSLAAALLCRMRGTWPTFCTGVRTSPFYAHAWIAVDGVAVGEPHGTAGLRPLMVVGPGTVG